MRGEFKRLTLIAEIVRGFVTNGDRRIRKIVSITHPLGSERKRRNALSVSIIYPNKM